MSVKYTVIFERAEDNWAAYVPDLPGCETAEILLAIQQKKPPGRFVRSGSLIVN